MLYSSLVTLGVVVVTAVLVTEEATSHDEDTQSCVKGKYVHCNYVAK